MEGLVLNRELDTYVDKSILKSIDNNNLKETIQTLKDINLLPFVEEDIYFTSNVWDFSRYTNTNVNKNKRIFKFDSKRCPAAFKDIAKVYTLFKILEDKLKIQSVYDSTYKLMDFLKYIKKNGYIKIENVDEYIITDYLNEKSKTLAAKTLRKYRGALRSFYTFYSVHFDNIITPDIEFALKHNDINKAYAEAKHNKSDDIPSIYFDKFVHECQKIASDTTARDSLRGTACIYLILSQTGLRIGECLDLRTDSLREIELFNGEKMTYLFYRTWKRVRRENGAEHAFTFANDITISAINILMKLDIYKERRKKLNLDLIYLGGPNMEDKGHFPLDSESFRQQAYRLYIHIDPQLPTINLPDNYYPGIKNRDISYYVYGKDKYIETVAMPTTIQFRVRVCVDLRNKGVHLKYIQKFMGHLTSEMTTHYATPKENLTQNQKETQELKEKLDEVISGKEKLIGPKSTQFMKQIQEFIEKNKFNVAYDLQEIIDGLIEEYPIKQKAGGYFVAPIRIKRSHEDLTSDMFYSNYGLESSQFTFYYMSDTTYRQTKELAKIVKYNMAVGFNDVAIEEKEKLIKTITELLEPELEELNRKTKEVGANEVLQKHPNLLEIVENYDSIKKEIKEWKNIAI